MTGHVDENIPESSDPASEREAERDYYQEQLTQALQTYAFVSPVKSLDPLRQGDVVVSCSGNFRLVLVADSEQRDDAQIRFLTLTPKRELKLETAVRSRIDLNRLYAVVVRRNVNPLGNFADVAAGLGPEHVIYQNIEILLQAGILGQELKKRLYSDRSKEDSIPITLYVSTLNGKIGSIDYQKAEPVSPIKLFLSRSFIPTQEYISRLALAADFNPKIKRDLIASTVFSNTIQNAINLVILIDKVEKLGGQRLGSKD